MRQLIGKKSKGLEPGYVWAPYIMVDKPAKMALSSRYSSTINPKIDKIKKILEKIEDFVSK